jgi:hypothetical protein
MTPRADEKLIVVPYQPGYHFKRRLLAWLAVLIGIGGGVGIGWQAGSHPYQEQSNLVPQLQKQLVNAQMKIEALTQQIAIMERGRAIDETANREVQTTILELESSIVQLREDVAFYKNIMAPAAGDKGLKIQRLDLWPGSDDSTFRYKLVLTQVANNNTYIKGVVAVNLIGYRGETKEILPLRDVEGAEELGLKFRFRYFQDLEGKLVLPEGFQAVQVQVVAQATGKNATKIERTFDWKVGE